MDDLLTTRQLQDLLRVDRITIYRMLNDGRLHGFKVGGQWRFSRREIEAWLQGLQTGLPPSLPAEIPAQSSPVLPMSCILAIQAICAEALDIAVVTTALDGAPLADVSNSCGFCNLILSSEAGRHRCASSWSQQPHGQIHPCHARLLCASFPIAVGDQRLALAAVCQFTTQGPESVQPHLPEMATSLGLLEADMQAAMDSIRVIPESHLPRISRLVRRVAETFSEIGQERLNLLGRLEKIAEMSRI